MEIKKISSGRLADITSPDTFFSSILRRDKQTKPSEHVLEKDDKVNASSKGSFSGIFKKVAIIAVASSALALTGCSALQYEGSYGYEEVPAYNYSFVQPYYYNYYQPPTFCYPENNFDDDDFGR